MNKLILLFLSLFLFCSSVSAIEIAVVDEGEAVPNILVEIDDGYQTRGYLTDRNGKFSVNLSEGYYWIEIDTDNYLFEGEVYLYEDELNILRCEHNLPGFGIIIVFGAVLFLVLLLRKRR